MSFSFDKLANPQIVNKHFKTCFKSFFESILVQNVVSEVLKTWCFSYSAFRWQANERAVAPPGYATNRYLLLTVY